MTATCEKFGPLAQSIAAATGWDGVTRALMLAGKVLPLLPDDLRTDAHYVAGCDSDVWVMYDCQSRQWYAYSPSKIIRGVLAVLLEKANSQELQVVNSFNFNEYLSQIKLVQFVSESRANGIKKVIERLQQIAVC